ncbi:hypothetical protein DYB38_008644 [Aphanomyces astaci]|uniref:DNA replication licensing factor MCM4 n=1 Tax=Aphanomyces astaci TaxID=112090 RepID=A0A397DQS5_APHAT|nr:hypothetical protein DYB38_008644 [Aphanomyces astaci]
MLFCFDDLVDDVRPGDKIQVTGIFRAVPLRATVKQRVVKSVFKTYVDVVHFRKVDELYNQGVDGFKDANAVDAVTMAKLGSCPKLHCFYEFKRIAADPLVYENLSHSLAPSIWELDDVKKGVLCQLFGGARKGGSGGPEKKHTRSDLNVLLCGDPGTSKSQLLSYVHKLAPRGIYTSGKGSSAVGLTASVVRDMETGDLVLESGALVLSDEGICCIDEFDKMSDSARSVLHEVMEQQTVSIAKAGIICSLNARASILASANPIESRYNPAKSVIENINILPTLLSRFDLIYLILDRPNADADRQLARHIVSMYYDGYTVSATTRTSEVIPMSVLSEYIAYAKKHVHPKLTEAAAADLIAGYLDLRRMGNSRKNITATPRQLESLIRISEALAKMKLSDAGGFNEREKVRSRLTCVFACLVTSSEVAEALRLMHVATQKAAMDPRTGTIDMDMITTGLATLDRQTLSVMVADLKLILEAAEGAMSLGEAKRKLDEARNAETKPTDFQSAIRLLEEESLVQISHGSLRKSTNDGYVNQSTFNHSTRNLSNDRSKSNNTGTRTNTSGVDTFRPIQAPADPTENYFPELMPFRIDHNEVLLTRAISRGAFGVVWLGHYHGQPVAIKRMIEGDDQAVLFSKEIQIMGRLKAPNIVEFIGSTWTSGMDLSAVTEFMDGGDVRTLLENPKIQLSWPAQKVNIAIDVALALAYLHGLTPKLIHRDLKSKNVLLTSNMVAKLSDFGLSRNRSYEETLTAGVGTVRWTAPEVMLGDIYSEISDVYSFGVVLSELDTREIPFDDQKSSKAGGAPDMSIVVKVARGELRPTFSPDCPASILQIAKACLQFDPALRPSSARVVEMLQQAKLEFTLNGQ